MKKNGFLTFLCALCPGFGQMYHGYMKRGVSLLFWFALVIAFSALTGVGALLFAMPVIWAYSFFDTFNIRSLSAEQRTHFVDEFIPSKAWMEKNLGNKTGRFTTSKVVGWVCIAAGLLILYNFLSNMFFNLFYSWFPGLAYTINQVPNLLMGVAIVVLGIVMLRRHVRSKPDDTEEIVPFQGGEDDNA